MMECSHEEADTQILLHAYHASQCGYRKILMRTVDTDLLVLAVSREQDLSVDESGWYLELASIFGIFQSTQLLKNWSHKEAGRSQCSTQSLDVILYLSFPGGVRQLPGTCGTCFHKPQIPS